MCKYVTKKINIHFDHEIILFAVAYLPLGQIGHAPPPLAKKCVFHHWKKIGKQWRRIGIFTKLNFLATPPHNDMVDFNGMKTFLFYLKMQENRWRLGLRPRPHEMSRQPPTSRPCQSCSTRSTLAPNPWTNIIQGVSHDVQRRQWNSADIHDWHGHAHLRSSRSVSSPVLPQEGLFDVPRTRTVLVPGLSQSLAQWPGMVSLPMFEPFATLSHLNQHSKLIFFQLAYAISL